MSLYTTPKGSHHIRSHYLVQSLNYLADQAGMTLFSLKNLNLGSSQTVFNPDGNPIADVVEITMRSSTIGSNTVDLVAKIQFVISSLVPNDVAAVQSKIEALSPFSYPELLQSITEIGKHEPIMSYIERVTKKITDHFEKNDRAKQLRSDFIETITSTFKNNLLECDIVNNTFASFMFSVPKDKSRPDALSTAIATFYLSDRFPDEYPKLTLTSPLLPSNSNTRAPAPEVIPISRYSPRWGAERIVTEIWEQLWDEIPRYHAKASQLATLN
ncbi:hypothetical protein BGX26_010653 [Mortierella sp. AD094]|nr:hypothetical protein BGX26_010653 [Mortierella sp. AD094]